MRSRSARRAVIAGRTRDAALEAWAAAVVANGGSVSEARVNAIEENIAAKRASGSYALTDDILFLWGENAAQALTSFKQHRLATAVAAPTFTANAGYDLNGTAQYLNTGYIPSTHGVNCTGTNQRLGVYERTNVSSSGVSAGVVDAAVRALSLTNRNGTVTTARANTAGINFTLTVADSRGLKAVSRAGGSTTVKMFDRGVKLTDGTAAVGTAAPTRPIYVGALNNAGTAASFRASSVGMFVVGGPLSDAQELADYVADQALATKIGAQV